MRNEVEILNDIYLNCMGKRMAIQDQMYTNAANYRDLEKKYLKELFIFLELKDQLTESNMMMLTEKSLKSYYEEKYNLDFMSLELIRHLKLETIQI